MTQPATDNDSQQKSVREEYPSGWLTLTRHQSVAYIIDALLDLPPYREFNQTELAEHAGVSRKSVGRHIDFLERIGVVERVPDTSPTRYRFNSENDVSEAIIKLDGAMNAAGPHTAE